MFNKKVKNTSFALACFACLFSGYFVSFLSGCDTRPPPELTIPIVKLQLSSTSPQTTVIITWTESTDAEEYYIERYCIKDSIGETDFFSIKKPFTYKYTDNTCEPGLEYTYIVYAEAQRGGLESHYYSERSKEVSITTEKDPLVSLDYPTKVTVKPTENNTNALTVEWSPVQNALSYDIYFKKSGYLDENSEYKKAGTTTDTSFTIYHLYNQKPYSIKIKALNDQKSSNFSAVAKGRVSDAINFTKSSAFKLNNSVTECFYSEGDCLWFTCTPEKGIISISSDPITLAFTSITVLSDTGAVLASGLTFDANTSSNADNSDIPIVKRSLKEDFNSFEAGKNYYLRVSKPEQSSFSICIE